MNLFLEKSSFKYFRCIFPNFFDYTELMSSNIPGSFDKADPSNLKVVRIEGDKHPSINIPLNEKSVDSKALTSYITRLLLFKKVDDFLEPPESANQIKNLLNTLHAFKNLLETLMTTNKCSDPSFAEALALHWHTIIQHPSQLRALIEPINHYPANTEHSLGYYLTQIRGEEWLPFPFITLLTNLHEEALLNPFKCTLGAWIKIITFLSEQ